MAKVLWIIGLLSAGVLVWDWAATQHPASPGRTVVVTKVDPTVPDSVAVRKQSPEVEAIIGELEEKARAAVGMWHTASGPEGKPGEPWVTGIGKDGAWYWASEAKEPSTTAGYVLFDDGVDAFVLPHGKNRELGGIRFQYDSIRAGFSAGSGETGQSYLAGYYLLHMNLMPRAFIGALGALSVVGLEKLDEADVIHLRADGPKDDLARRDADLGRSGGSPGAVDLYFDENQSAIIEARILTAGGAVKASVKQWGSFSTGVQWPAEIVGEELTARPAAGPVGGRAGMVRVMTVVAGFEKGEAGEKAREMEGRVEQTELFLTPAAGLRSAAFYRRWVAGAEAGPTPALRMADMRAGLAFASFTDGDIAAGEDQWQWLDGHLKLQASRERLAVWLMGAAGPALGRASAAGKEREACATVLARFVDIPARKELTWAADGAIGAWQALRAAPESQAAAERLTPRLLPRLVDTCTVFGLESLIRQANRDTAEAAVIDPVLAKAAEAPVDVDGFYESRQDFLVLAAVRAGDLARAQGYVKRLSWPAGASTIDMQSAENWTESFAVVRMIASGDNVDWARVAAVYGRFAGLKEGRADRVYGGQMIVRAGAEYWAARLKAGGEAEVADAIKHSAKAPGSGPFWPNQILQVARSVIRDPKSVDLLAPAIRACGEELGVAGYGFGFWMQLQREPQIAKDFEARLGYAQRAMEAAEDDGQRAEGIAALAQVYGSFGRFVEGARAVDEARARVADAGKQAALERLSAGLRAQAIKSLPADGGTSPTAQPAR